MKNKLLLSFVIITCLLTVHDGQSKTTQLQPSDSLIKVSGIITGKEEGKPITAKLFYEKLPYYDDMGISSSKRGTGAYELYMILGNKYMVEVKAEGYETIKKEITIVDSGAGNMSQNFILEPDFANKKITLENLNFSRGRSVIATSSYAGLDDFSEWLKARPNAIVQLEGHTDFQGNAEANMQLSQDRVDAVKDYLIKKGIKKTRMRTKAFGGTQPTTRDRTPEGRAQNRRVEVQVLQQ